VIRGLLLGGHLNQKTEAKLDKKHQGVDSKNGEKGFPLLLVSRFHLATAI
jgi:hypothetical protein